MDKDTGVRRERGCSDPICVILFLAFVASMLGACIYGYVNGHPAKLVAPYDLTNRHCGIDDLKEFPNLYFTKLTPGWEDLFD